MSAPSIMVQKATRTAEIINLFNQLVQWPRGRITTIGIVGRGSSDYSHHIVKNQRHLPALYRAKSPPTWSYGWVPCPTETGLQMAGSGVKQGPEEDTAAAAVRRPSQPRDGRPPDLLSAGQQLAPRRRRPALLYFVSMRASAVFECVYFLQLARKNMYMSMSMLSSSMSPGVLGLFCQYHPAPDLAYSSSGVPVPVLLLFWSAVGSGVHLFLRSFLFWSISSFCDLVATSWHGMYIFCCMAYSVMAYMAWHGMLAFRTPDCSS